MNQIYLKNRRRARKFDPSVQKQKNLEKKIEKMRQNKDRILESIKARIEKKRALKIQKNQKTEEKKKKKTKKAKKN